MDESGAGESSTSSSSPTPKAPAAPAEQHRTAPVQSSAAFLHHLHTGPKSHHITLSSGASRHASAPPRSKTERATSSEVTSLGPPEAPGEGEATPGRPALLRNASSKRSRPKTAPSRTLAAAGQASSGREVDSPTSLEPSPNPPSAAEMEGDSCIAQFLNEERVTDATDAMGMLSVSGDAEGSRERSGGSGRTQLVGRAGSLAPPSSPPIKTLEPVSASTVATTVEAIGWNDFAKNYAAGNFDPARIPQPPVQSISPHGIMSTRSSPGTRYSSFDESSQQPTSSDTNSSGASGVTTTSALSGTTQPSSAPSISPSRSLSSAPLPKNVVIKPKSLEAEHLLASSQQQSARPDHLKLPSYNLAAATVRMASASTGYSANSFAPLGVPSPDKELTDPMANLVSSAASSSTAKEISTSDPSHGSRYPLSRSMSSAIEPDRHLLQLPTIQGSPALSPNEHPRHARAKRDASVKQASPSWQSGGRLQSHIPPATAPLEKAVETETQEDYFGSSVSPPPSRVSRQTSYASGSSSSQQTVTGPINTPNPFPSDPDEREETPSPEKELTPPPSTVKYSQMGEVYEKYGYLPAPTPADDAARRRALYRFNILHTASDLNFDRIAHMAKLVFACKMVLIALIDGETQWHKTQSGPSIAAEVPRVTSFCAHTILSKNDEPLIVLDTHRDWRFVDSPNVTGPPHIRFYAGAPLRTTDGYNLGSLCLLDDKPRAEFAPRQRLILKEFAAVAMREMELWRDKLQLRVRDRIQTSMEKFTRECLELDARSTDKPADAAAKMDTVYNRAAQLVCSTLDMDECYILDLSAFELIEVETSQGPRSVYRADPYAEDSEVLERSDGFHAVSALPILASTNPSRTTDTLSPREHEKLSDFLRDCRDGKIYEHKPPSFIRDLFPDELRYAMVIPVFGINQQPFTLICAHTSKASKQHLEGYELQFLRAIGVILLSAVLRRRMVQADKAKSILISSVSHELRTPLHGILAAAELLSDTKLDQNQFSFLKTVQSCGNSLIETVNHVLDFTKLSGGNTSSSAALKQSKVNLATLIEQTVEGCWVGQRARTFLGDADVGSYYAPDAQPKGQRPSLGPDDSMPVEIVIDIAHREKGWNVRCEKGGLRRVLMNLIGNSLKFTKEGYIQVTLREMPHAPGSKHVPIEMAVIDTGKGIGKEFLKEQLFHPFSQENPLQTGTGLGLAIVNSIVRSDSMNGKVDVWSSEGSGTEIRISLDVEVVDDEDDSSSTISSASGVTSFGSGVSVSFFGFDMTSRGHVLSLDVLSSSACSWHFDIKDTDGDIIVVHEDESLIQAHKDDGKPIIFLTGTRRGEINSIAGRISKAGGFFHILYKPIGPSGLRHALQSAINYIDSTPEDDPARRPSISRGSSGASQESNSTISELSSNKFKSKASHNERIPLQRRRSEETEQSQSQRPAMAPRGLTYHHAPASAPPRRTSSSVGDDDGSPSLSSPSSTLSTISLADGGVLLKAAAQPASISRRGGSPRVLVVEDNVINRRVLGAFLKKRGFEWAEAFHGQEGVDIFASTPPNHWDVILMDISMPVMDGHEATRAIRKIEAERRAAAKAELSKTLQSGSSKMASMPSMQHSRTKIFALTGLATTDDKREAFGSGVDGYLVKPVSLASLDQIFKRVGFA